MAVWAPAPVGAHTEPGGRDKGRVKGAPPNSSESGKGEHRTTAGNSFLSESSLLEESLFFFFSTLNLELNIKRMLVLFPECISLLCEVSSVRLWPQTDS